MYTYRSIRTIVTRRFLNLVPASYSVLLKCSCTPTSVLNVVKHKNSEIYRRIIIGDDCILQVYIINTILVMLSSYKCYNKNCNIDYNYFMCQH